MYNVRSLLVFFILLAACSRAMARQASSLPVANSPAVDQHFATAQQAQSRQDYATAEREYRAVLALAPDFAGAHMNLGLVYQLQNRVPEAVVEFRRALKLKPSLAGANFFLGVDYCKRGEGERAIPYLRSAAREQPNQPDIWSWLATAQEISAEIPDEVATLKRGLALHPQDADLLYLLGHAYERLGKDEVATLEKIAPDSSFVQQLVAEGYVASGDWPSAEIHFENAVAASPTRPDLHVELGEALLHAGKLAPAAREFDRALQLDPHSLRAIVRRGEMRLIQGDLDGTLQDWTQAIAQDETEVEAILGIREAGFGDSALEELPNAGQLEELAPNLRARNSPAAHIALAFLAAQNGNPSEAAIEAEPARAAQAGSTKMAGTPFHECSEKEVRRALEQGHLTGLASCAPGLLSQPAPAEVRIQVARALFEAGDYEQAAQVLAALPPGDRHSAEAAFWRARSDEKLATAAYLKLYQTAPDSYRVHQLMGDLYAAKGEDERAMKEYRLAIAQKPGLPNLHYSLGHLLWKNFKVAEARQEFEAELEINPRHVGALENLGETYLFERQASQALVYLQRALAADPTNSDVHRDLGTAYNDLSEYKKAAAELQIAARDDRDGSTHYKLAKVYQALGQKDNAAREFALSTRLNRQAHRQLEERTQRLSEVEKPSEDGSGPQPADAVSLIQVAARYIAQGREPDARQALDRLRKLPLSDEQAARVAQLLLAARENEAAISLLRKLSQQHSAASASWDQFDLALAYLLAGRYEEAVVQAQSFRGALGPRETVPAAATGSTAQGSPAAAPVWSLLGIAYAHLGQGERSANAFRWAAQLAPAREEYWLNLTREQMELGYYAEAISDVQEGLARNPRSYALHLRLGATYLAAGRYNEAEAAFRELVTAGDPLPTSYLGLSQVLLRTGRAQEAATELVAARQKLGPSFLITYFEGLALDRAGHPEEAMAAFGEAIRLNPASAQAHLALGKVELRTGRVTEATGELRQALRLDPGNAPARRLLSQAYGRAGDAPAASKYAEEAAQTPLAAPEGDLVADFFLPSWQEPSEESRE